MAGMSTSTLTKKPIRSFVFLDLETTGLDPTTVQITELALVSVHRQAMNDANNAGTGTLTPRIVDKIVMCIDPEKEVESKAEEITGLSRSSLRNNGKSNFDVNICQQLESFFKRQERPICLIAHNGAKFDFPIFARSLFETGNTDVNKLDMRCADSLEAFRAIQPGRRTHSLAALLSSAFGNVPKELHSAEVDAIWLMKLVLHDWEEVREWLDLNSTKNLQDYQPVPQLSKYVLKRKRPITVDSDSDVDDSNGDDSDDDDSSDDDSDDNVVILV